MELFRKEAVESFSSRSGMKNAVRAVSIKTGVFTALLMLCAASFAFWLFFGTIHETVTVNGAIWPAKNNGDVYTVYGGTLSKAVVSEGDTVKAGDVLAVIPQEDILAAIEAGRQNGISEAELQGLYDEYDRRSMIRSAVDGAVTYIADENAYMAEGARVASVVPYDESGNNRTLTAFIPSDSSGFVTLGMEVQVMPDFAPRDEYGYIRAYISEISSYPVTGQSVRETSGELLAGPLDDTGSYVRIEITLIPDMTAQSGLKWSDPSSGSIDVAMGTVCTADIVVEECRPYEWLF